MNCTEAMSSYAISSVNKKLCTKPWTFILFPVQILSPVQASQSAVDMNGNNLQAEEDSFAEYFSDSPDGLISVPDWIIQKYFQPEVTTDSVECFDSSGNNDDYSPQEKADPPFLYLLIGSSGTVILKKAAVSLYLAQGTIPLNLHSSQAPSPVPHDAFPSQYL